MFNMFIMKIKVELCHARGRHMDVVQCFITAGDKVPKFLHQGMAYIIIEELSRYGLRR